MVYQIFVYTIAIVNKYMKAIRHLKAIANIPKLCLFIRVLLKYPVYHYRVKYRYREIYLK